MVFLLGVKAWTENELIRLLAVNLGASSPTKLTDPRLVSTTRCRLPSCCPQPEVPSKALAHQLQAPQQDGILRRRREEPLLHLLRPREPPKTTKRVPPGACRVRRPLRRRVSGGVGVRGRQFGVYGGMSEVTVQGGQKELGEHMFARKVHLSNEDLLLEYKYVW